MLISLWFYKMCKIRVDKQLLAPEEGCFMKQLCQSLKIQVQTLTRKWLRKRQAIKAFKIFSPQCETLLRCFRENAAHLSAVWNGRSLKRVSLEFTCLLPEYTQYQFNIKWFFSATKPHFKFYFPYSFGHHLETLEIFWQTQTVDEEPVLSISIP
jgi:hypothetical protein